ncbi:unnamed protein product [Choristocarpus tenellus]
MCEKSKLWCQRLSQAKSAAQNIVSGLQEDVAVPTLDIDDWEHEGVILGEGGFAKVLLVDYKGVNAAAKFPSVGSMHNEEFETELPKIISECKAMKKLKASPYVVELLDVVQRVSKPVRS